MAQENARERSERLTEEHSNAVTKFVNGEAPMPYVKGCRYVDGRKVWDRFEDYLAG